MSPADIIIVTVIAALVIAAVIYEVKRRTKSKRCGTGCVGCPHAGTCGEKRDHD